MAKNCIKGRKIRFQPMVALKEIGKYVKGCITEEKCEQTLIQIKDQSETLGGRGEIA